MHRLTGADLRFVAALGGGGPFGGMGMPVEKSHELRAIRSSTRGSAEAGSHRRQFRHSSEGRRHGPQRYRAEVARQRHEYDRLGRDRQALPASLRPRRRSIAALEAHQSQQANFLKNIDFTPGQGIDFETLGYLLLLVLAFYVFAAVFNWLQAYLLAGVTQRTMYRLRRDVEAKINRVPLSYVDRNARGELLSRVTNDIDNIRPACSRHCRNWSRGRCSCSARSC